MLTNFFLFLVFLFCLVTGIIAITFCGPRPQVLSSQARNRILQLVAMDEVSSRKLRDRLVEEKYLPDISPSCTTAFYVALADMEKEKLLYKRHQLTDSGIYETYYSRRWN